ncbi:hypothetical protein [Pedobacter sandarakinus]|uniref:hypothetical protein n=1 Tax=Pedobacter sandarakinus TaxID=353156 RepID=UPI002247D59B|nr:hypothetical protein [Pedobacter sandarakinus]MCX2575187.1 hypothetical protein [Pedobacter sandarakinus]
MGTQRIQDLFDKYEDLSIEVAQAQKAVQDAQVPDQSSKDSISAAQADEHLIACIELERKEQYLLELSQEWTKAQDLLVEQLCKINTKVRVIDRRDGDEVIIGCCGGAITIEEKTV